MIIPILYEFNGYKNAYIRLTISPSNAISVISERGEIIADVVDGYGLELVLKNLRGGHDSY